MKDEPRQDLIEGKDPVPMECEHNAKKYKTDIMILCCHTCKAIVLYLRTPFFDFSDADNKMKIAMQIRKHFKHNRHLLSFKIKSKCIDCRADALVALKQGYISHAEKNKIELMVIGW